MMIIRAEATVGQPIEVVWRIFTNPSTWKTWYGGELVKITPGWQEGGQLHWAMGSPSTITEFVQLERVTLRSGSGLKATFSFSEGVGGVATWVKYYEDFGESSLSVVNWGEKQTQCEETVRGLKRYVEARGQRRWWEFWK